MTDKEHKRFWQVIMFLLGLSLGLATGGLVTSLEYDSEIRTDQIELKDQVAEIIEDKVVINDLVKELINQIEQLKAERKSLEELRIVLSKGE